MPSAADLPLFTYPASPGYKARETSLAAAQAIAPRAPTLRAACLKVFAENAAGMTADEVAAAMRKTVLAIRPRVAELAALEKIEDTGIRRKNDSGRAAVVWRVRA